MNKEINEIKKYFKNLIERSKDTAYTFVYSDLDIACLEKLLDYIECLERFIIK